MRKSSKRLTRPFFTTRNVKAEILFDGSDSNTITLTSGAVSQWNDKSGNQRHATQVTDVSRPLVVSSALNRLDGLSFDGSNDFLSIDSYIAMNNNTFPTMIFVVAESSGTSRRGIIGTRTGAGAAFGWFLSYQSSTANPQISFPGRGDSRCTGALRTADINVIAKTTTTVQARSFLNTIPNPAAVQVPVVTPPSNTVIGREEATVSINPFIGNIYEILEIMSEDIFTRQRLEGRFAHKWGLVVNLPSDHPYRNRKPRR